MSKAQIENTPKPMGNPPFKTKSEVSKWIKEQREVNKEMVRGIFRFYEVPGGTLRFSYKNFDEESEKHSYLDGVIYTVSLGVARHLNRTGGYVVHGYRKTEDGSYHKDIGRKVRRYGFQSLEFVDVGENPEQEAFIIEPSFMVR